MRIISSPTETSLKSATHGVAGVTKAANGVAGVTEAANGAAGVRAVGVGLTKGVALSSLSFAKASISMVARSSGRLSLTSYCFCLICVDGPLTIPQICKAVIQISGSIKFIKQKSLGTATVEISVLQ